MRTEGDFIKINEWLSPLSWLYGLGVKFRNLLFDTGVLKSQSFNTPVISVGNITVGGSGKTPHVEYLIRLLQDYVPVTVLSRGYKRKTKGYQLANAHSTMSDIGDEPYQMKMKFDSIHIAVDAKRTRGIAHIINDKETRDTGAILLDDAYQHRYVKPGINILLVDYHRLIIYDKLIPAGRLREPLEGKRRADVVIITKCPPDLKPMEIRVLTKAMGLYPYQDLYFTTLQYQPLKPYYDISDKQSGKALTLDDIHGYNVLLLTGIASPKQILTDLKPYGLKVTPMTYGDHHNFKPRDIAAINQRFAAMQGLKIIITTEKDAARLQDASGLSDEVRANLYALPIQIKFMLDQEELFNQKVISYVRKNSRNSILVKRKDDNTSPNRHHSGNKPRTISFR